MCGIPVEVCVLPASMRTFASPCSPKALSTFLLGAWSLTKRLSYERGGKSGTFAGEATFAPLAGMDGVVAYVEDGTATLLPEQLQLSARHALLYDCRDGAGESCVQVFFDEASQRDSAVQIMDGGRFFHTIDFASQPLPEFRHPCGPDMYYGRLLFESEDAFTLDWRVVGPRKSGAVVSRFRRLHTS